MMLSLWAKWELVGGASGQKHCSVRVFVIEIGGVFAFVC